MIRLRLTLLVGLPLLAQAPNPAKNAIGMEFVTIAPGEFVMGCSTIDSACDADEKPAHRVQITKAFEIGKYEVTQAQWQAVMGSNPSTIKGDNRPVEQINWNEAQRFIWLMSFFGHGQYRLPSEWEYEYAARALQPTSRYWGNEIDDGCAYENIADKSLKEVEPEIAPAFANCEDGYAWTAPVGQRWPNPWGLYDMFGNVASWTEDCYSGNPSETPSDGAPNASGACTSRVIRGGSWYSVLRYDRAANRNYSAPGYRNNNLGFRLVRIIPP